MSPHILVLDVFLTAQKEDAERDIKLSGEGVRQCSIRHVSL